MRLGALLHQLLIMPLEILLEAVFGVAMNLFDAVPVAIAAMSVFMNLLLLPLYNQADKIQADEMDAEKKLAFWEKHIKKAFRGDERYMMLQTYYRQNSYKPYYVLKGFLPLVLEIPFFIAAYRFLTGLSELNGYRFGLIADLSLPDGLLKVGSFTVNILPVIMTFINILSSSLYSKGRSFKDRIKLYGMALVFLAFLYDSPSGLVIYWTLNNLFSLIKNLLYGSKALRKASCFLAGAFGAAVAVYGLFYYQTTSVKHRIMVVIVGSLMELPLLYMLSGGRISVKISRLKADYRLFLANGILLTVLTGILIPSAVISSSPEEFVQLSDFYLPSLHVLNSFLCAAGTFVIWTGVFFFLAPHAMRAIYTAGISVVSLAAVIDYMFFGTKLGLMSTNLSFENDFVTGSAFSLIAGTEYLINTAALIAAAVLVITVLMKKDSLAKAACCLLIVSLSGMSAVNLVRIHGSYPGLMESAKELKETRDIHFSLSRNGKNVVVLMLDRAIGGYIPYLFQENEELRRQFAGFTYYPNTLSFGSGTNTGVPALMGGYEYTPSELNRRSDESLESKHNEALKVMPVIFDRSGFSVVICDPVYAGYTWVPTLSIYDEYPDFKVFNTEQGQFSILPGEERTAMQNYLWRRNFFCYSIMKSAPLFLQSFLYQDGTYYYRDMSSYQKVDGLSRASGINNSFMNSFSVLCSLSDMTQITDYGDNFLLMTNQTTHQPELLQEPDYMPQETVDNSEYDDEHVSRFLVDGRKLTVENADQMAHYHVNMAGLIQVGKWLDYLRKNGVYDNTRIILVADHGRELHQFEDLDFGSKSQDLMMTFNPLLMVKDFNSTEYRTDNNFMTNADVPSIATADLVPEPVNPFTGEKITSDGKKDGELLVFAPNSGDWDTKKNNGNVFLPGEWYSVHDSIFDPECWDELGEW